MINTSPTFILRLTIFAMIICFFAGCKGERTETQRQDDVIVNEICGKKNFNLQSELKHIAEGLSGTPYDKMNATDCSGMFHDVLDQLKSKCPEIKFPVEKEYRAARQIADWYHRNKNFKIVRNPEKSGDLIKPGSVMFFGKGVQGGFNYQLDRMNIEDFKDTKTGIKHIGVVIDVKKENGTVVSYDIFHGIKPGVPAGISTVEFKGRNYPKYPAYSHWDQPWVGVADVLTMVQ